MKTTLQRGQDITRIMRDRHAAVSTLNRLVKEPMLLREWSYADPTGWIIQEKMDGCRMLWDGKRFWTRGGNIVDAPAWFLDGMPSDPLDGELWFGRGTLPRALSAIQGGDWNGALYAVFDAPLEGMAIEERLSMLDVIDLPSHAFIVPRRICLGMEDMEDALDDVATKEGEGIVLKRSGSNYEPGRSGNARKLRL